MVAGGNKRSCEEHRENRQARRRRLKREAATNESQTGAQPRRRILGVPPLVTEAEPENFVIQEQKWFTCLMISFNNLYGESVISFDDLDYMRRAMDNNPAWVTWRKKALEEYQKKHNVNAKRKLKLMEESMLNGCSKGYWSVNVLTDFLHTYTEVQLKKINPKGFKYDMTMDEKIKVIERTEKRYGPLMIMLKWNQYGVNQAHWISIKKGHVLDGQSKPKPKAVPLANYQDCVENRP